MKLTYLLTTVTCGFLGSVRGSVQDWQIQNLSDITSYTTEGVSEVSFSFNDPNTGLTSVCDYKNPPGSGRPATVESYTDCNNVNVKFTYIETSAKTGQIGIQYYITNEAGNVQGVENGTGIADLACSTSSSAKTCVAANTAIVPGPETGA